VNCGSFESQYRLCWIANTKLPHPDIAVCFSRVKSRYFITLGKALRHIHPQQFADLMIEQQWIEDPRRFTEIVNAESNLKALQPKGIDP